MVVCQAKGRWEFGQKRVGSPRLNSIATSNLGTDPRAYSLELSSAGSDRAEGRIVRGRARAAACVRTTGCGGGGRDECGTD
eukprot:COSAG02_NODE_39972_length_410_cov_1.324759_2_plen_80_part_01